MASRLAIAIALVALVVGIGALVFFWWLRAPNPPAVAPVDCVGLWEHRQIQGTVTVVDPDYFGESVPAVACSLHVRGDTVAIWGPEGWFGVTPITRARKAFNVGDVQ